MVTVYSVDSNSPAKKAGIAPGDVIETINGNTVNDVLDYRFYIFEKRLKIKISGKPEIEIIKDEYEDIGLNFETYLMDKQHSCNNKCIFCFIDQLPKGLRQSLYFKDDDSRLSFLFGNYVTLTNLTKQEAARIIKMHISPINISVHTTNKELRCKMMNNRFAGECLKYIKEFDAAGIKLNCQLVLMPGVNDGEELKRSLTDLLSYKNVQSVAAVPVGVTKFREGLYPIKPFDKDSAKRVIDIFESFSEKPRRCFAADEFYLKAQLPIPDVDYYGDFFQLENGVGMVSLFENDCYSAIENLDAAPKIKKTVATGEAAFSMMQRIIDKAKSKWHNLDVKVVGVQNNFFGPEITVTGLLTATDIINQLKGKDNGEMLLLSDSMLRSEKDLFLDDKTPKDLENALNIKVVFNSCDGYEFIESLTK